MPIVNIPDDSLLVFDHNGSLWPILKGESDSNAIGITDENNDEWYIDASNGNTYDLQIQASDDVTKTWFIALEVNMSELIGNPIVIDDSSGIDTSDATAAASDILSGKTAYVNGSKVTGNIATGSATAPASISGSSATVSTGTNTLTLSKTVSVTPSVSAGYVSSGTAGDSSVILTASVAIKNTDTITPGTTDQTIAAGTYIKGTQTIKGDANLVSSNIASGVSIFGVAGSHQSGTDTSDATAAAGDILSGKTAYVNGSKVTGTIASQAAQTITPGTSNKTIASGKYLSGVQTIKGDVNLVAGNIKSGVSIFGVNGSYNGPTSYSVPIARLATTPAAINASNKYTISNGSTVKSRCAFVVVPTNATNVSITFSTTGNIIAFLSAVNNITDGGTPDFSSSYGSRILKDNGTFNYAISSDMNIIYILTRDTSGNSHMPTSIVFTLS